MEHTKRISEQGYPRKERKPQNKDIGKITFATQVTILNCVEFLISYRTSPSIKHSTSHQLSLFLSITDTTAMRRVGFSRKIT